MTNKLNILFVCTGNTCRSPMAEWFFRDLCDKKKTSGKFNIQSAGTGAIDGWPASENAIATLQKNGIDAHSHRSQRLTPELLQWADIAIAMTQSHLGVIINLSQNLSKKPEAKLLSEFSKKHNPISDPFGSGTDIYEDCFSEMKKHLCNLYDIIEKN